MLVPGASTPENAVLKGVSLTVPPGRTVALVGPSGSGKSTLVKLLLRLCHPHRCSFCVLRHCILRGLTQLVALAKLNGLHGALMCS